MERPKNIYYQVHKTCAFPKFVTTFSTLLKEDSFSKVEDKYYVQYIGIYGWAPSVVRYEKDHQVFEDAWTKTLRVNRH
jgi:hypothetical protein